MRIACGLSWASCFIATLLFLGESAQGQTPASHLRVHVTMSGQPVEGALVELMDSSRTVVAAGVSNSDGSRVIPAPAGSYRVRVRRIGYTPYLSAPVSLPRSGTLEVRINGERISLARVVVTGGSECRQPDSESDALGVVWQEIAAGLQTSRLMLGDLVGFGEARLYEKEIGLKGEVFRSEATRVPIASVRPFASPDPASLLKKGYIRGDEYNGWVFFGPDESVLLSADFAKTHCFSVVRDSNRSGQIGVGFKPIRKRRVPDIAGVLWVDESTSALLQVTFQYVNTNIPLGLTGGGDIKFRRVSSGAVAVDEWRLTMPRIEQHMTTIEQFGVHSAQFVQTGTIERGGFIDAKSIEPIAGNSGIAVSGVVFDSLAEKPLAGAWVTVDEITVRTNRAGRFVFPNVAPGRHSVAFGHEVLKPLGLLAVESEFEASAPRTELSLSVPSLGAVWPRVCHDTATTRPTDDRRGILRGVVTDTRGSPADGARVRITWREVKTVGEIRALSAPDIRFEVITDNRGQYTACGFTSKTRGFVEALVGKRSQGTAPFDFARGAVIQRDLTLRTQPPRSTVVVSGTITDSSRSLPFAYIAGRANGEMTITDTNGRFRLEVTPVGGTIPLSLRLHGFQPVDTIVEPRGKVAVSLNPAMKRLRDSTSKPTTQIVQGYFESLDEAGFYRRMATHPDSKFLTRADLDRNDTLSVADLLRDVDGIQIVSPGGIRGREDFPVDLTGSCPLSLMIDGKFVGYYRGDPTGSPSAPGAASATTTDAKADPFDTVLPSDLVLGLEVYPTGATIPAEFQNRPNGCGMLVVWSVDR